MHLARSSQPGRIAVTLGTKASGTEIDPLVGGFCNELVDQQLREHLAKEAGPIREMIVAQAFAEGNLLDENRDDGDYEQDPLGLGRKR